MPTYQPISSAAVVEPDLALDSVSVSAVSWAAIFVGAAAAAALSLILVILGFGLGLSAVSPWSHSGASALTMGVATIAWLAFTQVAASAIGGYLAGRLRVKWVSLHTDEVYFRDTAHGFMAWAVASLVTAAFLGSALTGILGGGVHAGAAAAGGLANGAVAAAGHSETNDAAQRMNMESEGMDRGSMEPLAYFVDALFRRDAAHPGGPTDPAVRTEALKIFANDLHAGSMPDEDRQYLGVVVAQATGLAQADAEKRVTDKFAQTKQTMETARNTAKQALESARKTAEHSSLWMFIALLAGAFFASLAATFGGRRRDSMA